MNGESQSIEQKSLRKVTGTTADWKGLAKECVCFANARGGTILIGIEEGATEPPEGQTVPRDLPGKIQKRIGELPDGLFRQHLPLYDEVVVRELLVNALVHRPYTQRGDIFLNLYHNRLEIINPGLLPLGVTPRNILHTTMRRNEHLARVFHDLKLMEREGSGYDKIYEVLLSQGRPVPELREGPDRVEVTVRRRVLKPEIIDFITKADQTFQLSQRERITLGLLAQHEAVTGAQTLLATNREKYELVRDGVQVTFRNDKGERVRERLRVFDFDIPENNHFLAVRELWVRGDLYRRRADIVGFVNGLPLLFIECKNVHKNLKIAYEKNLSDYKDTIPHLFHHNAIIMLANGVEARIGSITSPWDYFHEWKRLAEEEPGIVDMETLLKGICTKQNFMDIFENFIIYDDSAGETRKILARNHQFLGVNRAVEAVRDRENRNRKLGVFWHTQGAGKSYSMVFFTRKVHRKLGGNFTFPILTDREDLDTQIYKTFAGCGVVAVHSMARWP